MSRLVTFGCSHTYGFGLEDCYTKDKSPGSKPSNFAWPSLLGNLLNLEVVNESKSGSGNAEIFHKILRYNFLPDDLVVTMWSHFVRFDNFVFQDKSYNGIRIWQDKIEPLNESIAYNTFINYQNHTNAIKNYLTFHHAALFLESKKIKNYGFIGFRKDQLDHPIPNFINFPNLLDIENFVIDKALDNLHFGIKSHKLLAELLYNKINELR